jgi:hypothetical protein
MKEKRHNYSFPPSSGGAVFDAQYASNGNKRLGWVG